MKRCIHNGNPNTCKVCTREKDNSFASTVCNGCGKTMGKLKRPFVYIKRGVYLCTKCVL